MKIGRKQKFDKVFQPFVPSSRAANLDDLRGGYYAFDPELTISGKPIEFIKDQPFKYVGCMIT